MSRQLLPPDRKGLFSGVNKVTWEMDVAQRWTWSQHWVDLLFLHWQVPVGDLRAQVPAQLEIATYDGRAWVSMIVFRLHVRPRWLPFLPALSALAEVNLRTYVRFRDRPGIWFLSIHADNRWAIRLASLLTPMPYLQADMCYRRSGAHFLFRAWRPSLPGFGLSLTFRPGTSSDETVEGTLDAWLLERYRLFVRDRRQRLMQAEVMHPRWVTRNVEVSVAANSIGESAGIHLSGVPDQAHYSAGVRAHFGAFYGVDEAEHNQTVEAAGVGTLQSLSQNLPGVHTP